MDRSILRRSLSCSTVLNQHGPGTNNPGQEGDVINVTRALHNKPIITVRLLICSHPPDKGQSILQLLSCFYRSIVLVLCLQLHGTAHTHATLPPSKSAECNIQVTRFLRADETSDKIFALPRKP